MKLVYPSALAVCTLALCAAPAAAQYRPRPVASTSPAENYHVELGAGFWNPSADMVVTVPGSGPLTGIVGTSIDLKKDLGLTDKRFPGNPTRSYRTRDPLRVVREVVDWEPHAPEVLQHMRDHLAELDRQGVEAINE